MDILVRPSRRTRMSILLSLFRGLRYGTVPGRKPCFVPRAPRHRGVLMENEINPARPPETSFKADPAATTGTPGPAAPAPPPRRSRFRKVLLFFAGFLLVYLAIAYLLMPIFWKRYVVRHPSLEDIPGITHTKNGMPGDPLNVALIGTEADVIHIMIAAGW